MAHASGKTRRQLEADELERIDAGAAAAAVVPAPVRWNTNPPGLARWAAQQQFTQWGDSQDENGHWVIGLLAPGFEPTPAPQDGDDGETC